MQQKTRSDKIHCDPSGLLIEHHNNNDSDLPLANRNTKTTDLWLCNLLYIIQF